MFLFPLQGNIWEEIVLFSAWLTRSQSSTKSLSNINYHHKVFQHKEYGLFINYSLLCLEKPKSPSKANQQKHKTSTQSSYPAVKCNSKEINSPNWLLYIFFNVRSENLVVQQLNCLHSQNLLTKYSVDITRRNDDSK